jgi:N-formylglutamate deformylase
LSDVFSLHRGTTPLLISLPHVGTAIPAAVQGAYVPRALLAEDTDWHLETLYAFAKPLGASLIVPATSRYVIDLNRPPDDTPMYPGAANTELCPSRFFTGDLLYANGQSLPAQEVSARKTLFWEPYHQALQGELERLRREHGYAVLWDGHSIRSRIPWLFDGTLPDLNLGTANAASCASALRGAVVDALQAQKTFSVAVDGRFKGGYITRHYGRPDQHIHALQMEMCQALYMEEVPPFRYDEAKAQTAQRVLETLLRAVLAWSPR